MDAECEYDYEFEQEAVLIKSFLLKEELSHLSVKKKKAIRRKAINFAIVDKSFYYVKNGETESEAPSLREVVTTRVQQARILAKLHDENGKVKL